MAIGPRCQAREQHPASRGLSRRALLRPEEVHGACWAWRAAVVAAPRGAWRRCPRHQTMVPITMPRSRVDQSGNPGLLLLAVVWPPWAAAPAMRSSLEGALYRLTTGRSPPGPASPRLARWALTISAKLEVRIEPARQRSEEPPIRAAWAQGRAGAGPGAARRTPGSGRSGVGEEVDDSLQEVDDGHGLRAHTGPEMPPSLRTRQKWTAIRIPATSGIPTQWRT